MKNDNFEDETLNLALTPFYMDKRKELISKVVELSENVLLHQRDNLVNVIDRTIQNQLKYFSLTPQFIIQYANTYIEN